MRTDEPVTPEPVTPEPVTLEPVTPEQVAALVERWLDGARAARSTRQARRDRQLSRLLDAPDGLRFAMAFIDRVMRAPTPAAAAATLHELVRAQGTPGFLGPFDRSLLRIGAELAPRLPRVVLPLAERRIRDLSGHLVLPAEDPALRRHLAARHAAHTRTNLNQLGEAVLGEDEATRRFHRALALLARDDVDYVSVKISAIASRLNLWAFDDSVRRIAGRLRALYDAAAAKEPAGFVNLDMEEYRDLDLTVAAFRAVLDEPRYGGLDAGIVLQAYLPDSFGHLDRLLGWAAARCARGGGTVKVRIVKGANLAMERVDAEVHGWAQAPYPTKDAVDANWKKMIDHCFHAEQLAGARIGVASHNLFDVAWAHLLAVHRGVADRVEFEMLEGMAPDQAAQVQAATGGMLLYTPIVGADEFRSAIAYLFRRLEENAGSDNFLRHLFELEAGSAAFDEQLARFRRTLAGLAEVSDAPRRTQDRGTERPEPDLDAPFANAADTDPALAANRRWLDAVLARPATVQAPPLVTDPAAVDAVVAAATTAAAGWRARSPRERAEVLERAAAVLARRRGDLIAVMTEEAAKVVGEADLEVSEAIDFARFSARTALALEAIDGARPDPFGVVLVAPPWNFPVAIPAGGVLAALAAGNAVIVKPPPEVPRCVQLVVECLRDAGVPGGVLEVLRTPDDDVGRHLVTHPGVDAVVLTGAFETAELFRSWRPALRLFAETSGKNALVITSAADIDGAVADLVGSAFGHAGQKCSAASLAIVEAAVYDSAAFQRQLRDAVRSLVVGASEDPRSDVGPLIRPPGEALRRALTTLDPGETWLVQPEQLSADARLWRPGVKLGVRPGSWFHQTECFGPVLGVMRAASLPEATAWQNAVPFGLTGGLWSLDPAQARWWLDHVEVGNAYVNRRTTGAIVRRQPFGGWKRSVVGPGAKAGGPNHVLQFATWRDDGLPVLGESPTAAVRALLDELLRAGAAGSDRATRTWLQAAAHSDAHWWRHEFAVAHDPSALVSERNEFRYRPLRRVALRLGPLALPAAGAHRAPGRPAQVARLLCAATCSGVEVVASIDPAARDPLVAALLAVAGVDTVVEEEPALAERLDGSVVGSVGGSLGGHRPGPGVDRVRLLGAGGDGLRLAASRQALHVESSTPVAAGRIELLRWVREQAVSRTVHRYGNLLGAS